MTVKKGNRYSLIGYPGAKGDPGAGVAVAAGSTTITDGTALLSNANSISFGMNTAGVITASISFPAASVSDHTHTQYINTSQSSTFFLVGNSSLLQASGNYLTTAMQSASSSVFAKTGFTSSSVTGTELKATHNTDGLSMLIPAWLTTAATGGGAGDWATATKTGSDIQISTGATNTLHYGNFLTVAAGGGAGLNGAITGGSMTVNTSGISINLPAYLTTAAISNHTHSDLYQSTGAYLTTAAQSGHTHGSAPSITGGIGVTSNSTAWSISIPAYITTAMQSGAGSNFVGLGSTTATTAGSDLKITATSAGINLGVPKWITTAAASDHTHSNLYVNTSVSGNFLTTAMVSNAGSNFVNLGSTTASTAGSELKITAGSAGINLGVPKWITTAAAGGGVAASIGGNSTSAGAGYSNVTSGTVVLLGGNNITLSQNGASITISGANIGGAQTGISGAGVSNTTYTSGTVIYSADANITIGSSVNGASQYVKFSVGNYITTGAASDHTHSNLYQSTGAYLTTAMVSNAGSNFVNLGSTTNSTAGSDLKITAGSAGINLGVPKWLTTAMASENTSLYQSAGAYLTTAAQSGHTHGSAPSITGNISVTSNSTAWSVAIGAYITTAMSSNEPHIRQAVYSDATQTSGTLIFTGIGGISIGSGAGGSVIISFDGHHMDAILPSGNGNGTGFSSMTSGTLGLNFAGVISGSQNGNNLTISAPTQTAEPRVVSLNGSSNAMSLVAGSSLSASSNASTITFGLASNITTALQSAGAYLTTAMVSNAGSNFINTGGSTTATTAGSDFKITMGSAGLNFGIPKWITTAMASENTSLYQSAGAYLTTAAQSGHTHGAGGTVSTAGSDLLFTSASNSWQLGVPKWLTTAQPVGAYLTTARASNDAIGLNTAGTNVTWTVNSGGISLNAGAYLTTAQAPGAYLTTAAQSTQTNAISISGNVGTTGSSVISAGGYVLAGGANITLSQSNNSVSIVAAAPGAGGGVAIANSQTTYTSGTALFRGTNATINTSAGGQFIDISVGNYITTAMVSNAGSNFVNTGGSTTASTAGSDLKITMGSAGLNFGVPKWLTTALASESTSVFAYTSNSTNNSTAAVHTSVSNSFIRSWELEGVQTAGTTGSLQSSILYLSGGNMMTLSGNSNTIVFSVNTASLLGTGAAASFLYTSASSNASTNAVHTSVSNSFFRSWELEGVNVAGTTGSLQGSILYLSGGNNITLSGNSNTIVISAGAGGGGIAASISAGGNSTSSGSGYSNITSGTLFLQGGDNITLSQNGAKISIIGATANGPASIVFSDANGVAWGSAAAGSTTTITASVSQPNRLMCEVIPGEYLTRVVNISATQVSKRIIFNPFWLDGNGLQASTVRFIMSWITSATAPIMTYGAALYSRVNNTSFALHDSTTATLNYAASDSAAFSGIRVWDVTGMTKTLSEGRYLMALYFSATATGNCNASLYGASAYPAVAGFVSGNAGTGGTADTKHLFPMMGYYSATTAAFPANVQTNDIYGGRSADVYDFYAVIKEV